MSDGQLGEAATPGSRRTPRGNRQRLGDALPCARCIRCIERDIILGPHATVHQQVARPCYRFQRGTTTNKITFRCEAESSVIDLVAYIVIHAAIPAIAITMGVGWLLALVAASVCLRRAAAAELPTSLMMQDSCARLPPHAITCSVFKGGRAGWRVEEGVHDGAHVGCHAAPSSSSSAAIGSCILSIVMERALHCI
jgi:hypothetical protein